MENLDSYVSVFFLGMKYGLIILFINYFASECLNFINKI